MKMIPIYKKEIKMNSKTTKAAGLKIQLPSLLAFERKLEASDGLMFSGKWEQIDSIDLNDWKPIDILPRYNRSTQSAYGISDEKKSRPNPVAAANDDAFLPQTHDTLKVSFSLRVIGALGTPFACNSPEFTGAITQKIAFLKDSKPDIFKELAKRYAMNIVNGRWLWRNRVGAEHITIKVTLYNSTEKSNTVLIFNAYDYDLNHFNTTQESQDFNILCQHIEAGLKEQMFNLIFVEAFAKIGNGQHVFPSQEMNMGEKRKSLFKINNKAAMHNVKIGNALRTIDNWYADNASFPIAAEPFGAVTQHGVVYRKSVNDLYTLLIKWLNDDSNNTTQDEILYILSNLIRGGLFQGESKNNKSSQKDDSVDDQTED